MCMFSFTFLCMCLVESLQHGLVFDAGSSHTEMYIYQWQIEASPKPILQTKKKVSIPVSNFADNPEQVGPQLLESFMIFAEDYLKSETDLSTFPILLGATAGVRTLERSKRIGLMNAIRNYFAEPSVPFLYEPSNIIILSGEEEGYFGWVAANYMLDRSGLSSASTATYGSLDMGGASLEATFEVDPSFDILDQMINPELWGIYRRIYSHSFLGFGQNLALEFVSKSFLSDLKNPCLLPKDSPYEITVSEVSYSFTGTGDLTACSSAITNFLNIEHSCADSLWGSECAMTGVYFPIFDHKNIKITLQSGFAYTEEDMENVGFPMNATLPMMENASDEIFGMTFEELTDVTGQPPKYLMEDPFNLLYQIATLRALGFDDSSKFLFNSGLDWTTGSIVVHAYRKDGECGLSTEVNDGYCDNPVCGH